MSTPFIGQIMMAGFNFAPRGWAKCDGQLLSIAQYSAVFSLLGTAYGGDGRTTFGLPNLQSRFPMHQGRGPGLSNRIMGQTGGEERVTLLQTQMPSHNHTGAVKPRASTQNADQSNPANHYNAVEAGGRGPLNGYRADFDAEMGETPFTTSNAGGGQSHDNMPPFQVVNFVIALQGLFPPRS